MSEDQNRTLNDKFMLRLPDGMRDKIKASAELNGRSMNGEIVDRLEETFRQDDWIFPGLDYQDVIAMFEKEIEDHDNLKTEVERERANDRFDAMKDEILEEIRKLKS